MASAGIRKSGFNTTAVIVGVVAGGLFIYSLSLFLQGGFLTLQAQEHAIKTYDTPDETVTVHHETQRAILAERTRWLDKEQGKLNLPIDGAIDRFVAKNTTPTAGNDDETN